MIVLTERDKAIIEFISNCPSRSDIICETFFKNSLVCCQKRLKLLVEYDFLKRDREFTSQHYIYYTKKRPRQIEHTLQISKYYSKLLLEGKNVVKFSINRPISQKLITDAIIAIQERDKIKMYLLEVEISSNNVNPKLQKYQSFYESGEVVNVFSCEPEIIFITNKLLVNSTLPINKIKPFKL